MKAVVFSGTTEGRRFSKKLAELGVAVTVCVATPLGAEEQGEMAGITVHAGRLQPDAMAALLAGADLCVDATHPYAVDATRNIRAAAVQAGVEYRRLLRAQSPLPPGCAVFETAAQAAEYLAGTEGNILLATGAKELAVFAGLEPARLYPRVLPTPEGIAACEAANVPHRNIIAMQGPFSLALNKALITQFQIRYLVTKDGGAAGGKARRAGRVSARALAGKCARAAHGRAHAEPDGAGSRHRVDALPVRARGARRAECGRTGTAFTRGTAGAAGLGKGDVAVF